MIAIQPILLIENNPTIANSVNNNLLSIGLYCNCIHSINQINNYLTDNYFRIIIVDVKFIIESNFDLIKSIRSKVEYKNCQIIAIAENINKTTKLALLNHEVDSYFEYNEQDLLITKIKLLCNQKKANDIEDNNYVKQTLTTPKQYILHCIAPDAQNVKYSLPTLFAKSQDELLNHWAYHYITNIVIDEKADWAINNIKKISEYIKDKVGIIFCGNRNLLSKDLIQYFDLIIDNYAKSESILSFVNKSDNRSKLKLQNIVNTLATKTNLNSRKDTDFTFGKWRISILCKSFDALPGGDFYEVIEINDHQKLLVIGDIMGNSWRAWTFSPIYISYIRSAIWFAAKQANTLLPHDILSSINRQCSIDFRLSEIFTTLSIILLDEPTNKITIASAGATLPLYLSQNVVKEIESYGLLIGLNQDAKYKSQEIELSKGEKLLFYTDGYSEAPIPGKDMYVNKTGIQKILCSKEFDGESALNFEECLKKTFNIDKFKDDRTLILISQI